MLTTGAWPSLPSALRCNRSTVCTTGRQIPQGEPNVDPEFVEVLERLGALRRDGVLGFRFDTQAGPRTAYLLLEDQEGEPLGSPRPAPA